jgi:hypothetical protein
VRGRSLMANQTTSTFFFVSGLGSGAYSAKLLNGTKQRFRGPHVGQVLGPNYGDEEKLTRLQLLKRT